MLRSEQEIHILWNGADADEGYFSVSAQGTTQIRQLVKRIGRENFRNYRELKDLDGTVAEILATVPIERFSRAFGITTKSNSSRARKELSLEERTKRAAALLRYRAEQKKLVPSENS